RATKKHIDCDQKQQYPSSNIERVKADTKSIKQDPSHQSKESNNDCANDNCTCNDNVALYIIEMSSEANNDWCESNRIDDCQKCHECAYRESYHEKRPPKYCVYYITLKV